MYLGDKELNVVSFQLLLSVLEYQTAVMRRDFEIADKVLPTIPKEQRTRVAHFLEKQGFKEQALVVSSDAGMYYICENFGLSSFYSRPKDQKKTFFYFFAPNLLREKIEKKIFARPIFWPL